jgi:hypothetical protein
MIHRRFTLFTLALPLTILLGLSSTRGAETGKRLALLIGVNRYDNRNLSDLEYAERDVQELSKKLQQSYQVQLFLGSASDESRRATKANVEAALERLFGSGLTKDDTVLIAIAGHGQQVTVTRGGQKHDEPFFCPRDAVPGNQATLVNLSGLIERLGERGGGTNLLLVDACRNDPDPSRGRGIDGDLVLNLPKGMAVFFSCSKGERAQESAKAGGGHGLFFHYVLEGLGNATIRNAKGELKWERLVAYVKDRLEEEAPKLLGAGTPVQTPHEVANLARSPVVLEAVAKVAKFHSEKGRFLILMPAAPKENQIQLDPSAAVDGVQYQFEAQRGEGEFVAAYQDIPNVDEVPRERAELAFAAAKKGMADQVKGTPTGDKSIKLNDRYYGRDLTFDLPMGKVMRVRLYFVGVRFYVLVAVGTGGAASSAEAEQFLDSFEVD